MIEVMKHVMKINPITNELITRIGISREMYKYMNNSGLLKDINQYAHEYKLSNTTVRRFSTLSSNAVVIHVSRTRIFLEIKEKITNEPIKLTFEKSLRLLKIGARMIKRDMLNEELEKL